ncbi:unnamed protein product [Mytilus edulis]|uniref:Uncharacterized protein n=1 Tax=Mytilus edulis TaxID=6550 RepID=A0A8S3S0D1_MYTED|nr:unnamed protein product [Mytilus edulis]
MSNSDPDLDVRSDRIQWCNTDLLTDGAVSLFSTVSSIALEQQKNKIIQHFDSRFAIEKSEKATGVDATFYIQERSFVKFNSLDAASRLISEEKETLGKRNKILKIADKHGWDTVQEYLDRYLADNKDDAVNLQSAITRAISRRRNSNHMIVRWKKSTNSNGRSDNNGTKFNTKEFFRGFSQFHANDGTVVNQTAISISSVFTATNLVTSRVRPFKGVPSATVSSPKRNRCQNQHEFFTVISY